MESLLLKVSNRRRFILVIALGQIVYVFVKTLEQSSSGHPFLARRIESFRRRQNVFVSYAYSEGTRGDSARNLAFFLRHGVYDISEDFHIMYGIVVNGDCTYLLCEDPVKFVRLQAKLLVRSWRRQNTGFDFGAHSFALQQLTKEGASFQYYIFLNCGVVGPIVPSYMPQQWHWSLAFIDKLRGNVGLVGTSIVCLPPWDSGGFGPSVEGFAFAMTKPALDIVVSHGTSFRNHKTKVAAILYGEYALTDVVMRYGFTIDSLLLAYADRNWSDEKNWYCNNLHHPSRRDTYFGISLSPLEVIFHKVHWGAAGKNKRTQDAPERLPVMLEETERYMKWADTATMT